MQHKKYRGLDDDALQFSFEYLLKLFNFFGQHSPKRFWLFSIIFGLCANSS